MSLASPSYARIPAGSPDTRAVASGPRRRARAALALFLLALATTARAQVDPLEVVRATVGGSHVSVGLSRAYTSPVVVCSANYAANTTPVVVRVSSVTSTSFAVRLQNPSDGSVAADLVSCLVVEQGVHNVSGVRFEAQRYSSTVTDSDASWVGQTRSYGQSYTSPVVIGQVMTENDPDWSVFWSRGATRGDPPSAAMLRTGKTVGEDPDTTRASETVGVVVFETGHGFLGGLEYEARLGGNTVQGVVNGAPFPYAFATAFQSPPNVAVVSLAGMNGPNGAWAQTHGASLATATTLYLSADEDQTSDSERDHTSEQVSYVAFAAPIDNDPPLAAADTASTNEDAAVTVAVLANDSEPDGDALSVAAVTQPPNGTVAIAGASVTYTPRANFCGSDSFGYTASDGRGGTSSATVGVAVACVNDPPNAQDDAASTIENVSVLIQVLANDTDPDANPLVVAAVTAPARGTAVNEGTGIRYVPYPGLCGADAFSYTASDGQGGADTANVAVSVTCINQNPVAAPDAASTNEDTAVSVAVLANDTDADGDLLSVSAVTQPVNGTVTSGGTSVTYTPQANFCGQDGFGYTASDGSGGSASASVSVTVACVNDAPVAADDSASLAAGGTASVSVLANDSDVDGGALTITSVTQGARGTVTTDGATVTYVHDGSATTADSFGYTVGDGLGGTDTGTVAVAISPPGGSAPLEVVRATVGGSHVSVGLSRSYTSPVVVCSASYAANTTPVVVRVSSVTSTSFSVRLQNPSDGPVAADAVSCLIVEQGVHDVAGVRFEAQRYTSTTTDSDAFWFGQARSYGQSYASPVVIGQVMSENDPDWSVFWSRGATRGDPPSATTLRTGKTVGEDPDTTRANETVGVVVFEAGHGVVGGLEYEARLGGNSVQGVVNGAPFPYAFATAFQSPPSVAVVSIAGMNSINGAWAQTHGASFATATTLYLSVDEDQTSDSERDHPSEQVSYVAFAAAIDNDPPVAAADTASTNEDTAVTVAVLANDGDPDGDALSVAAVTQPPNGTVAIAGASVTYTPRLNFCGSDGFGYTASDGRGGTSSATVGVAVACVNDPPSAQDDTASVTSGGSASVSVLANDTDVDGPALTISSVTQGAHGAVTTDGVTVGYAHDGSAAPTDSFSYTLSDGAGGTDVATVTVGVGTPSAGRPNILLMIADDVGLDAVTDLYPGLVDAVRDIYTARGHANAANIRGRTASTPNLLDRVAEQGMAFSAAWAQPVCSPTRAALITGLFAAKTGVTAPGSPMSRNHTTFVQLLKSQANYRAAMIGKWHLGTNSGGTLPKRAGFDVFRGHSGGAVEGFWSYSYHVQDAATSLDSYRTDPTPTRSLPGIAPTSFAPVVKASDAINTITAWENDDPDRPWFVWLAFNEAHSPMHVPNADTLDAASFAEVTACGGVPGTNSRGSCSDKVLVRAMTNAMDTLVGRVLDAVEAIDPNTYVIFIGDNGTELDSIDNLYLTVNGRGKGTVYESGAKVALAIRGPGISGATRSGEFVHAVDLYATILDMAGVAVPTTNLSNTGAVVGLDSRSLLPILRGESAAVRDPNEGYVFTETSYLGTKASARNARYKVVCSSTNLANCGFYDLVADPIEEYPLSKPASCTAYRTTWTTANASWHFCRLIEAIGDASGF